MVFAEIRISGAKSLNAKMTKLSSTLRGEFAPAVAEKGFDYARNLAPQDTGALKRAIQLIKRKESAEVRVYTPAHSDGRGRPYQMWMHDIPAPVINKNGTRGGYKNKSGKYRPKSGIPDFMFKTREYMTANIPIELDKQMKRVFGG